MTDLIVSKVDKARLLLAEARDASDAKKVADMARAAEVYARRQKLSDEAINYATGVKIEAMALMGEFLKVANKNEGGRPIKTGARLEPVLAPTLADAGITKKESSNAQLIADVKEEDAALYDKVVSGKVSISQCRRMRRKATVAAKPQVKADGSFVTELAALIGQRFACIYADPPWRYSNQATRASTDNHYKTLSVDEICALPVKDISATDAHLHLWTTNAFLFECPRIFQAWGFDFKSSFVWVKPQMGIGNYWRNSHELLLLGVRGKLVGHAKNLMSWGEFKRSEHSAKPDEIRQLVEKLSPGPYLELFGRKSVSNWTVFGNESL